MTKNQTTTVKFVMEKATPGTIRFQEVDDNGTPRKANDGAVVGTLYIRKTALGSEVPQKLTVTIAAE